MYVHVAWITIPFLSFCLVYKGRSYIDIVLRLAEQSMIGAIEEVKALSHYETEGEARNTV